MVTIGSVVVTMEASMGEVIESPKIYTPWLNTSAKSEAKKIFSISRWSTCSCLQNADSSQKQAAAPTMRNVVTDKAENSISADLPMGAISPHKILAVRANMCPCTFLFILFFLLRLQKNNYFLKLKSLFSFYILVVCWKYISDVLYLYVGRVASICRMCRIYISNATDI